MVNKLKKYFYYLDPDNDGDKLELDCLSLGFYFYVYNSSGYIKYSHTYNHVQFASDDWI